MQNDILLQISAKIKEYRKARGITLQELASRAEVSKGLVSQIENNRTIPSLLVLINLVRALEVDMNEFFSKISQHDVKNKVIIKQSSNYQSFEKEESPGFLYKRILTRSVQSTPIDFVLLELEGGASRPFTTQTDAYEFKYVIRGCIKYHINGDEYQLNQGDSLFFDANLPHSPSNVGTETALMLAIYFYKA
ncbi:MAG: XRE family transcriptional regulator [Cytophagia bacterium]|nr:MAG: XRE family transcriptional regulator [Runella sp.]TAG21666.1 MAG: XRE family transcriptional regulator [Cytophagales bacterium]TAG41058.1 MAG: XRE family transcriptional regulator [Cytophagia bacterium]TAG54121.1 MAG: XRE family transcriptional regulator [Runella slithyformis]TAG83851.1 MAG: XRE family transcriptional regulator [Cytophagales bacterium]